MNSGTNAPQVTPSTFTENGKHGLKKEDGTILLPAEFDDFILLSGKQLEIGDRVVVILNDKQGIVKIEEAGWSWVLIPEFDIISYPNSIVGVKKGDVWGILNLMTMEYIVPLECEVISYENGFIFCNDIAIFCINNKWGVLNSNFDCTAAIFDEIEPEIEGVVRARIADKWGFIDINGQFTDDSDEAAFYYCID